VVVDLRETSPTVFPIVIYQPADRDRDRDRDKDRGRGMTGNPMAGPLLGQETSKNNRTLNIKLEF
jgi:hypothetical protein